MLNFDHTDGGSTFWLSKGTAECVVTVGGLQPTFIMSMGGVEIKKIGESITTTWSAYAESVTPLDIRGEKDDS